MGLSITAKDLKLLVDGATVHGLEKFKFDNISIRPSHIDEIVKAIFNELGTLDTSITNIINNPPPTSGVLGPARDGTYLDGIFPFTETTPVGFAVDDLNEIILEIAPPPAPALSDWSGAKAGLNVSGKLSFDSTAPIAGQSYVGADGAPDPVTTDGDWVVAGKRLGIAGTLTGDITGILNDQVVADTGLPNPAFPADSFGDGEKGTMKMFINGTEVVGAFVDMTVLGSHDTTAGNTLSGLTLSAAFDTLFPKGSPLTLFQNRTGTWTVVDDDPLLVQGYNYVEVEHDNGSSIITLTRFDWIIDDNIDATIHSGEVLDNLVMTGSKKISGIDYHTAGTAEYDINIDNAYRNTYNADADAISHAGTNLSASVQALAPNSGNELQQVVITDKTATIVPATGLRILNDEITLNTTTKRTVQGSTTSTGVNIDNILLDNVIASATDFVENFNDEDYRLPTNFNFDSFGGMVIGAYDGENSIKGADAIAGYSDGLQVIGGKLIYPGGNTGFPGDFQTSVILNGSTFNDGGTKGGARDYTTETGNKVYPRWFRRNSPTTGNFTVTITGSAGVNFVPLTTPLTGNNAHLEMRGPTQTGFMDGYVNFVTGQTADGDGARAIANGAGGINAQLGLTMGTKSTANTGGKMVLRITTGPDFDQELDTITFNFL